MSRGVVRGPVIVLLVLVSLVLRSASVVGGEPVKLTKTWQGEIKIALRDDAPKDGYIADKEAWEKLWKGYRPDEKVPEIDFTKEFVLVAVNRDPNQITISASVDAAGELTVRHASTKIGFRNPETCKYQLATITFEGIKTVNGKPLTKK